MLPSIIGVRDTLIGKKPHKQGWTCIIIWIYLRCEALTLWPPDAKSHLIGKDPYTGKDWGQKEKGMTKDEMVGWHQRLDGHEFKQSPGVDEGYGSLACCSPWGCKESDMTEWLNNKSPKEKGREDEKDKISKGTGIWKRMFWETLSKWDWWKKSLLIGQQSTWVCPSRLVKK